MPKKSANQTFKEAYRKNPEIVKKFIRWKVAIFAFLLVLAFILNRYLNRLFSQ